MTDGPDYRISWFKVLADLCEGGGSLYKVAAITSIPRTSLQSYRNGREPAHSVGMCLLRHWSIKTGRDRDDAPVEKRYDSVSVRK